jgi:hypothetical protein
MSTSLLTGHLLFITRDLGSESCYFDQTDAVVVYLSRNGLKAPGQVRAFKVSQPEPK